MFRDNINPAEGLRMQLAWTLFCRYDSKKGFTGDRWNFFTTTEKMWSYITSLPVKSSPLYIVGHNIFFDLQCSDFFYYLTKWGWRLQFTYDKGLVYLLGIYKGPLVIKCLSSTNFFPFSLEKLGEMIGVKKIAVDFKTISRADLITYCHRDVEILQKGMSYYLSLIADHDLGSFKFTRASQAFNSFRYRFMFSRIYLHKHPEVTMLEQKGYFGGRVEARFLGKCPGRSFVHLDVNSLYPFVMKENAVPVRLIDHGGYMENSRMAELLEKYCCMADCDLVTPVPAYAYRHKGKLVFPTGRFRTVLCSEGLKRAIKNGHLKRIFVHSVYEKANIFTEYVDYWHALKERYSDEGNIVMKEISKNFLNFLYGKFAQQRDIIEQFDDITYDGYWREEVWDSITHQNEVTIKLFNCIYTTFGREPTKTYFVAIAAHITEYARFHLFDLMQTAELENVLYCDTDSLKMKAEFLPLYKKIIHPSKLGMLKLEDTTKHLSIFGAKYYTTEKVSRIKGVPTKARQTGEHTYIYTEFFRQTSHMKSRVDRYVAVREVTKTVKPFYDKGEVLENGKIIPLSF